MLMVLLQSVAFVLAQLGYIAWTRRRTGLDVAFVPALVFTAQGLAVFAGGMLGLLPQSAWAVVVVGLALLAVEAWRAPDGLRELVREPALWLLAGAAVALAWYLRGQVLVSYDNFSHWALVVRVMLAEGRFPTAEDTVVVFQSYPLGSASFVYLFNRTLTAAESVAMLAQQLLTFSYVLALLSATPRRKGVGVVAVVGTYWVVAEFEIFVNSLLVDTLLGVMSGYLVVLVWANRDRLRSLLLPIAIVMAFLAMTKNSGLFTVVLASVAVLVLTRVRMTDRRQPADVTGDGRSPRGFTWWLLPALLAPWAFLLWWTYHVSATFPEGMESKHSMSAGRFEDVFGEKTRSDVEAIVRSFANEVLGDVATVVLLFVLVVAVVLLRRSQLVRRSEAVWLLVGGVLSFALYVAGILAMFLLSMPLEEALRLAGLHRYLSTAHLAWFLVVMWLLLAVVDAASRLALQVLAAVTAAATLFAMSALANYRLLPVPDSSDSARAQVDQALAGEEVPPGDTVCVVLNTPDSGFRRYIVRYVLVSPDVEEIVFAGDEEPHEPERCDHFVVLTENAAAERWFAEQGIIPPGPAPYLVEWVR